MSPSSRADSLPCRRDLKRPCFAAPAAAAGADWESADEGESSAEAVVCRVRARAFGTRDDLLIFLPSLKITLLALLVLKRARAEGSAAGRRIAEEEEALASALVAAALVEAFRSIIVTPCVWVLDALLG